MPKRAPKNGKRIKEQNTLLVDGNSLFKVSYHGAKNMFNSDGVHVGGIFQFMTQLRKVMNEKLFHQIIVFWDGNKGGKLRWDVYKDYKISRNKDYINGSVPIEPEEIEQERQKLRIKQYLEELCIKQFSDQKVESDDFIGYFCLQRKSNEKISIITGDADICQLIDNDVDIFFLKPTVKTFVNRNNYRKYFNHHQENVLVFKMLLGDSSDDIKGVKGLGVKTLLEHFPEIAERPITLDYVINKAKILNKDRTDNKKKPLKVLENIVDGITDGVQGNKLYEINEYIINLKKPLLTEDALNRVNNLIDSPMSSEGRSIKNAYTLLKGDGIDRILSEDRFVDYFIPFKKLIERNKVNKNII